MYVVLADSLNSKHAEKFMDMDSALAHWQSIVDTGNYPTVSLVFRENDRATNISRSQEGEYRVKLYVAGEYQSDADYFTTDRNDAEMTAVKMRGEI